MALWQHAKAAEEDHLAVYFIDFDWDNYNELDLKELYDIHLTIYSRYTHTNNNVDEEGSCEKKRHCFYKSWQWELKTCFFNELRGRYRCAKMLYDQVQQPVVVYLGTLKIFPTTYLGKSKVGMEMDLSSHLSVVPNVWPHPKNEGLPWTVGFIKNSQWQEFHTACEDYTPVGEQAKCDEQTKDTWYEENGIQCWWSACRCGYHSWKNHETFRYQLDHRGWRYMTDWKEIKFDWVLMQQIFHGICFHVKCENLTVPLYGLFEKRHYKRAKWFIFTPHQDGHAMGTDHHALAP